MGYLAKNTNGPLKSILSFIYFPIRLVESQITKQVHLFLAKHNPEKLVRIIYRQRFNKILDLDDPQDLNEKINWLKVREIGRAHV